MVPPTLLLTSCRAARPYLRYLPTYLGMSPTYLFLQLHTSIQHPIGKAGAKTVYLHNRIWKQQQQPWPRCERTSRFLEALTSNNPPGHPEGKTRQPPSIQTFKSSAFAYLPTYLKKSHKGKKELQADENNSPSSFPLDQTTLPTHEPTRLLALDYPKEIIKPHLD